MMNKASTSDKRQVTPEYAGLLADLERGHSIELFSRECGFFVTLRYPLAMPEVRIDAFLLANDGGCPFFIGFVRRSLGIHMATSCYVSVSQAQELRETRIAKVVEIAGDVERTYDVEVQHAA